MAQPWILIPAHNRRELTLGCLRHLRATLASNRFHIAVIDDGSTDHTSAAIQAEFPEVEVIAGDGQLWWTGAMERGMRAADRAGATAVVWLNDDVLPAAGTLDSLLARATERGPAIVGATCFSAETDARVANAFVGRTRVSAPPSGQPEMNVDGLSGFCVAIPQAAWARIGFPDAARFPHYYGDSSYTVSARRAGIPVVLRGDARVQLTHYSERPATVAEYRRKLARDHAWREVFRATRSPFRLATQWHYLRLRYGALFGSALAVGRIAKWQLEFIAAATGAGGGNAADR